MESIKKLVNKYRAFILYAIFGVLTTVINIAAYYVCADLLLIPTVPSTIIAWILAVLFAFFTNRTMVFGSNVTSASGKLKELVKFIICRIATGVLDVVIMYVSVDVLNINGMVMKVISNILVIKLNFVFSKLVVFNKKA